MSRRLHRFPGGLKLDGFKALSNREATVPAAVPDRVILPLQQHIGEPAEPLVKPGQRVLKGETIASPSGYVSVPIHASTSGTVIDVGDYPVPHPSGLDAACIVIEADGEDEWCERLPVEEYATLAPSQLRNLIRDAGIVGMGGAGFPTFIKLNPGPEREVDTVVLNGAECEPYITCDDRLMRERPEEIVAGARIIRHAVQAKRCVIGVEDNKPEAFQSLQSAAFDDIEVVVLPTLYPTGGEKELVQMLTGLEVPSDGLPVEIGAVVQNVATAVAIYRAVEKGEPLISRYVTDWERRGLSPKSGGEDRYAHQQFAGTLQHGRPGGHYSGHGRLHDGIRPTLGRRACRQDQQLHFGRDRSRDPRAQSGNALHSLRNVRSGMSGTPVASAALLVCPGKRLRQGPGLSHLRLYRVRLLRLRLSEQHSTGAILPLRKNGDMGSGKGTREGGSGKTTS